MQFVFTHYYVHAYLLLELANITESSTSLIHHYVIRAIRHICSYYLLWYSPSYADNHKQPA